MREKPLGSGYVRSEVVENIWPKLQCNGSSASGAGSLVMVRTAYLDRDEHRQVYTTHTHVNKAICICHVSFSQNENLCCVPVLSMYAKRGCAKLPGKRRLCLCQLFLREIPAAVVLAIDLQRPFGGF